MKPVLQRMAQRLTNYDDPQSLGSRMRRKRLGHLVELIRSVPTRPVRIIDIGGRHMYWQRVVELLDDVELDVTLVNIRAFEPDASVPWAHYVVGDGRSLPEYADASFDIAHSNSVIEHVGGWFDMAAFAAETRRLASRYYVQVPFFWFPVEPHCVAPFIHWLPRPLGAAILRKVNLGHWSGRRGVPESVSTIDSARLPDRPMMRTLFPDAELRNERVLLVLTKSLIAVKA